MSRRKRMLGGALELDARLAHVEWPILLCAAILLATGVAFVWEMAAADLRYDRLEIRFEGHLKKVMISLPMLALGFLLRPRWLRRNASLAYFLALLLLALVPFVGEERNYARRWIAMPFGFDLQPSELAKLAIVVALARALWRNRLERAAQWVLPVSIALVPMGMVALQPDLGTALTIVPVTLGMFHLAGARGRAIGGLCALLLGALLVAWKLDLVQDYQVRRIDTWVAAFEPQDLIAERNGSAFHTYHARVSIGNGGWRGTGLGEGIANRAGHLPERESDSIFAVVAEEVGLLGASALIGCYTLFVALLLVLASGIRERFARLVVGGIALYFGAHFTIHVAVNLGLLPMTGLTLPLLSTGGSSLLTSLLALGVALGLGARWEPSLDGDAFRA